MADPAPLPPTSAWRVGAAALSPRHDELRVVIDGEPVWVRAVGRRLTDGPEAWATLLAIPAARTETTLELAAAVDAGWLATAQANIAQAAAWWGGRSELDLRTPPPTLGSRLQRYFGLGPNPVAHRALCFTGGVDSFFSLLVGGHRPSHLLYVHGFDLALDDTERRAAASRSIQAVAAAHRLIPIEVETDLRQHHAFAQASWEHTHGAALACIGLLLRAEIGTLVIPPSYAASRLVPWGSRPDLDPGWSVPGALTVEHGDAGPVRRDRLRAIAADPLVHDHLRVCWAHLGPGANCGRCEKCVRTMVDLEAIGALDAVTTFPRDRDLPELIDGLGAVPPSIAPLWRELRDLPLRPEVLAAIDRVLPDSGPDSDSDSVEAG